MQDQDDYADDPDDYLVNPYDGSHGPVDALLEPADDLGPADDRADKSRCTKRLFCSQEMPVGAPDKVCLSQDDLQEAVQNVFVKEPKKTG